ncbi:hypothetical protein ECB98_16685 [Brucellaceae bacterium VT-16-1752]|nr:hypothetical protein ECB98_16685 [Brucellaceae bacterium VT-16-1752]
MSDGQILHPANTAYNCAIGYRIRDTSNFVNEFASPFELQKATPADFHNLLIIAKSPKTPHFYEPKRFLLTLYLKF